MQLHKFSWLQRPLKPDTCYVFLIIAHLILDGTLKFISFLRIGFAFTSRDQAAQTIVNIIAPTFVAGFITFV